MVGWAAWMEGDVSDAPILAVQLQALQAAPSPTGWSRKDVDATMAGFVDI